MASHGMAHCEPKQRSEQAQAHHTLQRRDAPYRRVVVVPAIRRDGCEDIALDLVVRSLQATHQA